MSRLLIRNIGLLQTPVGSAPLRGAAQGENRKLRDVCIFVQDGIIIGIYDGGVCPLLAVDREIDAKGKLVTPGLVDCHTHLVFGGWRQHEVPLKLQGASYLEILQAGGGILNTLNSTRNATAEQLFTRSKDFLDEMLKLGVTTCEIKSGYGLSTKEELKQLEVISMLQEQHKMEIVSTFMAAHAVPPEYKGNADGYVDLIVDEMLPLVKGKAVYCDAFCEEGVFTSQQCSRVLMRAKELGMELKLHADEIEAIGGAQLAAELGAVSAEHLIATDDSGIQALAEGSVIADLLPQTSFYLGKPYANARGMIEAGVPVAIASDFNPGSCPSYDLQFAMRLGLLKYKLKPEEVLSAVTLNAACSIGLGEKLGSVEVGKQADLVIWDAEDFDLVLYRFGVNMAKTVIKKGEIL